jgi:nicotinate-nucleotide pyrophosphorylase (carboxylating)
MRLPPELDLVEVRRAVSRALEEDLGAGDRTTAALFPEPHRACARLVARADLVLAGNLVAREVFAALDPLVEYGVEYADGESVRALEPVATLRADVRAILTGERTALNFLMRMCGIASAARAAVAEVAGTGARILDTRKTAPGLRYLDKYAVACGGATNHRRGLYDALMIKDTHLAAGVSLERALHLALDRGHAPETITVEVQDLAELRRALDAGARRVLLDNMDLPTLRLAVSETAGRAVLEASGGLCPGRLRDVAATGVNFLSVGWITHSAPAADLALELEADR